MKLKNEKGFTGVDIAIAIVVLFMLISLVASLSYRINSTSKQVEYKAEATDIAINLIEQVKANGFETYATLHNDAIVNIDGETSQENMATDKEGFYQTITVTDYADENSGKIPDVVKIVTVRVSYMFKGEEQSVELTTKLSKES